MYVQISYTHIYIYIYAMELLGDVDAGGPDGVIFMMRHMSYAVYKPLSSSQ